jgi:hypothetical protein
MKQNETLDQKELESINSEIFHSFDPDDDSWIIGGRPNSTVNISYTASGRDVTVDLDS